MLDHESCRRLLEAYRMRRLAPEEETEVEVHLLGCGNCHEALEALEDAALVALVTRDRGTVRKVLKDLSPPAVEVSVAMGAARSVAEALRRLAGALAGTGASAWEPVAVRGPSPKLDPIRAEDVPGRLERGKPVAFTITGKCRFTVGALGSDHIEISGLVLEDGRPAGTLEIRQGPGPDGSIVAYVGAVTSRGERRFKVPVAALQGEITIVVRPDPGEE